MTSIRTACIAIASLALLIAADVSPAAVASPKVDKGVYAPSPAPLLPAAGGTFRDPDFGTQILRLTDAADGSTNHVAYSYWPTFNKDSTYLHISRSGTPTLYQFDPDSFQVVSKGPLFTKNTPIGTRPGWEDSIWSATDPNVLYAHEGPRLWAWNVATKTYTLVKDFTSVLPAGEGLGQMSRSMDDNVFAFSRKLYQSPWSVTGYAAWQRDTNTMLASALTTSLDEVQVDKSGRYMTIKTGAGSVDVLVKDFLTGTLAGLTDGSPDYSPGHSDNGSGIVVGADNWTNRYTGRSLANPHSVYTVLSFGSDWSQASHVSMLADGDQWALLSMTTGNAHASNGIYKDEILMVATDGSQRVIRLAHHRTDYRATGNYWDLPLANISRDGRFVAYTSNWGNSGREDVYILRVPPAGDANLDYMVDDDDLSMMLANWGTAGKWEGGDFTANGMVNDDDLSLLLSNWTGSGGGQSTGQNIPEPATIGLLILGGLGLLGRRRRRA